MSIKQVRNEQGHVIGRISQENDQYGNEFNLAYTNHRNGESVAFRTYSAATYWLNIVDEIEQSRARRFH